MREGITLTKFDALKILFIMKGYIKRNGWDEESQEIIDVCKERLSNRRTK